MPLNQTGLNFTASVVLESNPAAGGGASSKNITAQNTLESTINEDVLEGTGGPGETWTFFSVR